jgi:hypothetical protein
MKFNGDPGRNFNEVLVEFELDSEIQILDIQLPDVGLWIPKMRIQGQESGISGLQILDSIILISD